MEFLLYLSSIDKEIVNLIYKSDIQIKENTFLCLKRKKFMGALNRRNKTLIICTENIKNYAGYTIPTVLGEERDETKLLIRETLRHEAVHVAQNCNEGNPLALKNKEEMKVNTYKESLINKSAAISKSEEREHEAYWLENKPELVINSIKRFCF